MKRLNIILFICIAISGLSLTACSYLQTEQEKLIDYVEDGKLNFGKGIEIDGIVWAPVNCGYRKITYQNGQYFQWGRRYGQGQSNYTLVPGPVSPEIGNDKSNASNFYYRESGNAEWQQPHNDAAWNAGTENKPVKASADPCPSGWRVPTATELASLATHAEWGKKDDMDGVWIKDLLFLSAAGAISYNGAYCNNSQGYYYSSTPAIPYKAEFLSFSLSPDTEELSISIKTNASPAEGFSIRCVQE
ncbi:MAG: hypothetical protein ACI3ZK_05490 [Candidatus Cryptobacteroides sp.]